MRNEFLSNTSGSFVNVMISSTLLVDVEEAIKIIYNIICMMYFFEELRQLILKPLYINRMLTKQRSNELNKYLYRVSEIHLKTGLKTNAAESRLLGDEKTTEKLLVFDYIRFI